MIWKTLHHPNVLQLLGVTMIENELTAVSEWMTNENIDKFIKGHPNVNQLELVRFSFGPIPFLYIDVQMITVACRCRQGFDLYARPGDSSR